MKKFISVIFLVGITLALFSCAVNNNPSGAYIDGNDTDEYVEYSDDYYQTDTEPQYYIEDEYSWLPSEYENEEYSRIQSETANLPERDFQAYEFIFLAGDNAAYTSELHAEQETGSVINDSVYKRNTIVKEKYNIDIECDYREDVGNYFRKYVMAGEKLNASLLPANFALSAVQAGLVIDTASLPYVDFSKPWWDKSVQQLGVLNKNYFLGGDLLISDNEATQAIVFNKTLFKDYGLESPYQLVMDGLWTFGKMNEMVLSLSLDLNGDSMITTDCDRFGLYISDYSFHSMLIAGDGALVSKDESGVPYISLTSDRSTSVLNEAMRMFYTGFIADGRMQGDYMQMFEQNRLLFVQTELSQLSYDRGFRTMDADCGILPLPKFDVAQEMYCGPVNPDTSALLAVPISVDIIDGEMEKTGFILEALAAESRKYVQPAYYNLVLCGKYYRDDESEIMLDIIFGSRVYDMGAFYNFGAIFTSFIEFSGDSETDITSFYEQYIEKTSVAIEKFTDMIRQLR